MASINWADQPEDTTNTNSTSPNMADVEQPNIQEIEQPKMLANQEISDNSHTENSKTVGEILENESTVSIDSKTSIEIDNSDSNEDVEEITDEEEETSSKKDSKFTLVKNKKNKKEQNSINNFDEGCYEGSLHYNNTTESVVKINKSSIVIDSNSIGYWQVPRINNSKDQKIKVNIEYLINGEKHVKFIEPKENHFYYGMVRYYNRRYKNAKVSVFKIDNDEEVEDLYVPFNVKDISGEFIFDNLEFKDYVKFQIINNIKFPDSYQVSVIEKINIKKGQIINLNKSKGIGIIANCDDPKITIKINQKNLCFDMSRLKKSQFIQYVTDDFNNCLYLSNRI